MLYHYFGFLPESAPQTFRKIVDGDISQFPLDLKQMEVSDQYAISDSLLLSVMDNAPDHSILAFLNTHTHFFVREIPSEQNASQYHKHDYFELVYVLDGQLDLLIENTHHRLLQGDACIINFKARHMEQRLSSHTVLYLGIKPDALPEFPHESGNSQELYRFFIRNKEHADQIDYLIFTPFESYKNTPEHEKFDYLFYCIVQEFLNKDLGFREMCSIYIGRIFSVLQNPVSYICSNTRFQALNTDDLFDRTLRYLNEHPRKISRSELENALSYNGNYISRVFQRKTGQSLSAYNRDICMTEAARLLLNTNDTIREICLRIGYENKTVFYDLFRKKYGMTPNEYRMMRSSGSEMLDDIY